MRVFDKTKTNELTNYDLEKGYLKPDKLFIAHHEATEGTDGVTRYEVMGEYPNGGKSLRRVTVVEPIPPKDAYDEYEDIQVYIPYTEEELLKRKEQKYTSLVERYIRERYSLSAELAILRQRDTKTGEFAEYFTYAEECKIRAKAEVGM